MGFENWLWPADFFKVHPFERFIRLFNEDRSFLFDSVVKLDVLSLVPWDFRLFLLTHRQCTSIDLSSSFDFQSDNVVLFVIFALSSIGQFN